MPPKPGVYIFKDQNGQILYVGKANNLRHRVYSYFQPPIRLGPKTAKLVSLIARIDHIEVHSETEALLLESKLINKFIPPYNIASRDDKSPYYIHITREKFPKPILNHESKGAISGPFLNSRIPRSILYQFRRIAPYCTSSNPKRPCLYSHIGLCNPCPGNPKTSSAKYTSNISRLKKLLRGEFKQVMAQAIKNLRFETAAALRDLILKPIPPDDYLVNPNLVSDLRQQALDSLQKVLGIEHLHRIELYDIAHLSGTAATGAMTVAIDGELTPRNYRHFTIRTNPPTGGSDDVAMLQEVLTRRLAHTDWSPPDLIVLDGGKSQLSIVTWSIPTIALAKKEEIVYTPEPITLPRTHPGLQLLQRLRDEAHRFSRRLHHKLRTKTIRT